MCCFSGPINSVAETKIFGRLDGAGRQIIIYSMAVDTSDEVAMVLPVPIKAGSGENAMKFVNLEKYAMIFDDMAKAFPEPEGKFAVAAPTLGVSRGRPLAVASVGAFEASFVPTVADFDRLDKRFRLPEGTWEKLPGYKDFGFAVFKLKKGSSHVHPMAFTFPTAQPNFIFFPTLHIHDGKVHKTADFDHTLYCQATGISFPNWIESSKIPSQHMKMDVTAGLVTPDEHLHRRSLWGRKTNTDVILKVPV